MTEKEATDERPDPMTRDNITEKAPEIPDDIPRPDPDKDRG